MLSSAAMWAGASQVSGGSWSTDHNAGVHHKMPSHLIIHGIRFDSKTGGLDAGSKALLDSAVDLLKSDPNIVVSVSQHSAEAPNGDRGLSPAQAKTVASYIRSLGIPAVHLDSTQASRSPAGGRCDATIGAVIITHG